MTFVYDYIRNNGISTYSSYPYGTTDKKCKNGTTSGIKITGYVEVPRNEESLKQAVGEFPLCPFTTWDGFNKNITFGM